MAPWHRRPGETLKDVRRRGLLDGMASIFTGLAPQPPPKPRLRYKPRSLADDMRAVEADFDRVLGRRPSEPDDK